MGRWFWRWLYFLAGICLTAACGQSPSVRSETPPPTLLRFTPSAANLPIGSTIRPFITATPLTNQPLLTIAGLVCYETPAQSLICLGWAQNPLEIPLSNITLSLNLIDDTGEAVAIQTATLARDGLPPNSGAPYRFIFPEIPPINVTPQIGLLLADEDTEEISTYDVQHLKTEWIGQLYKISGEVHNKSPVEKVKIVVTVRNESGSVIGFRTLIQTENTFETTIILLEPYAPTHTVTVTADGIKE